MQFLSILTIVFGCFAFSTTAEAMIDVAELNADVPNTIGIKDARTSKDDTLYYPSSELYFRDNQPWNIYPNPAGEYVIIQLFDPELIGEYIEIRDLRGTVLYNVRLENMNTKLDITLLESGMYILSILDHNRLLLSKLIVNK